MGRPILIASESFHSTHAYRPPWRLSEKDVGRYLNQAHGSGWSDQDDHLQGKPLPKPTMIGLEKVGSTRPDFYHAGQKVAVEVKNWPIDRIATLAAHLRIQMAQRRWSMPAGTCHWMYFDLRGQRVGSLRELAQFIDRMLVEYRIECEEVWFVLDSKFVRAM